MSTVSDAPANVLPSFVTVYLSDGSTLNASLVTVGGAQYMFGVTSSQNLEALYDAGVNRAAVMKVVDSTGKTLAGFSTLVAQANMGGTNFPLNELFISPGAGSSTFRYGVAPSANAYLPPPVNPTPPVPAYVLALAEMYDSGQGLTVAEYDLLKEYKLYP